MVPTQLTGGLLQLGISKEAGGKVKAVGKAIEKGYKAFKGLGSKGKKVPIGAGSKVFKVPLGGAGAPSTSSTAGLSAAVQSAPRVNPYSSLSKSAPKVNPYASPPASVDKSLMHLKPPLRHGGRYASRRFVNPAAQAETGNLTRLEHLQKARAVPQGIWPRSNYLTHAKWLNPKTLSKQRTGVRGIPFKGPRTPRQWNGKLRDAQLSDIVGNAEHRIGGFGNSTAATPKWMATDLTWNTPTRRAFQSARDLGRTFRQVRQGSQPARKLSPAMKEWLKANKNKLSLTAAYGVGGTSAAAGAGVLGNQGYNNWKERQKHDKTQSEDLRSERIRQRIQEKKFNDGMARRQAYEEKKQREAAAEQQAADAIAQKRWGRGQQSRDEQNNDWGK
jgi:hypothetical protein